DRVFEPVTQFSGGERARLALALLVQREPNLLLLDEPTNHLDLDMRHALEVALQSFDGAVVTVSHDRHLLRATCDELWLVADGRVAPFDGDLDDYARWLAARQNAAAVPSDASDSRSGASRAAPAASARARRRDAAERRAREKPLRDAVERLERELETHRERLAEIERALADPELYASGEADRLAALAK